MDQQQDIVDNLRTRASIRRQIQTRKSVQEGKPDRIADLLDAAATEIETLRESVKKWQSLADANAKLNDCIQRRHDTSDRLNNKE